MIEAGKAAWQSLPQELYEVTDDGDLLSIYGDQLEDSRTDNQHLSNVIRTLIDSMNDERIERIEMIDFNKRDDYPVLPFNDGTSVNLRTKELLPQEEVLKMKLMDHDWNVLPPKSLEQLSLIHI